MVHPHGRQAGFRRRNLEDRPRTVQQPPASLQVDRVDDRLALHNPDPDRSGPVALDGHLGHPGQGGHPACHGVRRHGGQGGSRADPGHRHDQRRVEVVAGDVDEHLVHVQELGPGRRVGPGEEHDTGQKGPHPPEPTGSGCRRLDVGVGGHSSNPTITVSGTSRTPWTSATRRTTSSMRLLTSSAEPPSSAWMKLA